MGVEPRWGRRTRPHQRPPQLLITSITTITITEPCLNHRRLRPLTTAAATTTVAPKRAPRNRRRRQLRPGVRVLTVSRTRRLEIHSQARPMVVAAAELLASRPLESAPNWARLITAATIWAAPLTL